MGSSPKARTATFAAVLVLAALVATAAASAATAGGLDRSYGQGGVTSATVPVGPPGGAGESLFATAPDGSAYVLKTFRECGAQTCSTVDALYRWAPGGQFDSGFGGQGFTQASGTSTFSLEPRSSGRALVVDSAGRPLVSHIESGQVVVRRFTAAGALDGSFGVGGVATVSCGDCERAQVWLLRAAAGRVVVEVQNTVPPVGEGFGAALGGQVSLTRLTPGGFPEKHFAGGTTTIALGLRAYPGKGVVTPKGGVLLGSVGCCSGAAPYLLRVSAKGRIDKKFGRAAGRSLARLSRQGETAEAVAVLPRRNGRIELVGTSTGGGFDLRLKANGDRARFGKGGLRRFPFAIEAAALGSGGGIFAIGSAEGSPEFAYRLLADGKVDPAYGSGGVEVPIPGSGFTLGTPAHGRTLVFGAGFFECRSGCPAQPGIAAFAES